MPGMVPGKKNPQHRANGAEGQKHRGGLAPDAPRKRILADPSPVERGTPMGRRFKEFFEIPDHGKVGYTLSKRGKFYFVRFYGPRGNYERIGTGMREQGEARNEAAKIVERVYCPMQFQRPVHISWDEMIQKLQSAMTANGNREMTCINYASTIRVIQATLPDTTGPGDIGPYEAQRFKDEYLNGGYTRSKGKNAPVRKRSQRSFNSNLRQARAIWGKWLKELKIVKDNPWLAVADAKVDRKPPEAPDESVMVQFFQFVKDNHPNWDMPILFLQTKCLLGCRLMDLCSVRSDQLRNGALHLDPEQLKACNFRRVPLPANLYRALDDLKGETFLWERFPEQFRQCREAQGRRIGRLVMEFSPKNFASFILDLFTNFQKATGQKLKSHMLRKRALTLLFAEGVSAEVAATMLGMDVQTARRYYLDMDKIDSGKKFTEFADKLIPEV